MHPILFHIPWRGRELPIYSYGALLAIGFIVAAWVARRHARRIGEDPRIVGGVWIGLVLASLGGARLLFVVTNPARFVPICRAAIASGPTSRVLAACTQALRLWEGGDLVFYGGAIGCLVFLAWYTRRHGLGFARVLDLLIPSVALGHAFGRVGCFLAGCCYGAPSDGPWAVRFGRDSLAFAQLVAAGKLAPEAAPPPLHPVQLYEAAGELALFFALARLLPRRRYDGQAFVAWLAGYGLLRFALEFLRGDDERRYLLPHLSTSQSLALVAIAFALAVELWPRRRAALAI
jgi:phosphatidylglycerol:prolipoprotein diacylglycerol transferase